MSFADRAYKAVLKQLKKEGRELVFFEEEINTRDYKSCSVDYKMLEQEELSFPEEILEQNSVSDIINAFKKYYIGNYESPIEPDILIVAEPQNYYGRSFLQEATPFDDAVDDLEETDEFDEEYIKDYPGCALAIPSELSEKKSKEEILKDLDQALQNYLKAPEKTVSDFVIQKQNTLNLKPADVYKPVFMTRQNYSKIISNYTKHPKFEACIQLAFGLKLDLADTTELLRRAGNAFSDDLYDRVIQYFIEKKQYDIIELNICLDKIGEKPIGSF